MKIAYPTFSNVVSIDCSKISAIVIENKPLFRSFLYDLTLAIDGCNTDIVLSKNDKILDPSKNAELLTDFINFNINKKPLLNKILSELEKTALAPENYVKTQELIAEINRMFDEWAFSFPCNIVANKISVSTLLKSAGIELQNEYEGHIGEAEKLLDYMELVREFERDKLFITVNMRSYFDDNIIRQFQKTAISHEFKMLMIESQAYSLLEYEKRITIDEDLCEF